MRGTIKSGGGWGGERQGEKGAEGVQETGVEGTGRGIPKVAGSGRKGKITQHCVIFCNRGNTERWELEPTNTGRVPGGLNPLSPPLL